MSTYKVIVVGTDGSETSYRAVDEAARIAAEANARLIVASAFQHDRSPEGPDPDQPAGEGYRTEGGAPIFDMLVEAKARAKSAGVKDVEERAIEGAPVDALVELADEVGADLLVVGNFGLKSVVGRVMGSVPSAVRRRANTEVLIVETD
ncbi:universal stress protein [Mycolicibacterium duvalii]|uniref:Universal stress protein n=1 Tax=Mycolicibacterium duvalii TaxID=39688 RepID=A0A7I7JWU3_9MYCO|nr:universal stress protein [Mycolicibacterium duvalii]MCV7369542.1 universal stress protein [Mycolicibacterium duvalii]PEG42174.1 universal stress protein [Mycolicibacterium duvalii]BBX16263.1 universal stress protein [Mycolicibacterium duvalii]